MFEHLCLASSTVGGDCGTFGKWRPAGGNELPGGDTGPVGLGQTLVWVCAFYAFANYDVSKQPHAPTVVDRSSSCWQAFSVMMNCIP